jgi:CheY-like chemotaxis protein
MSAGRGTVLVVEADPEERERFGSWLEGSGFDVLECPGPTEPDYTCVGARDGVCPLVQEADVVVLDMSTESEAVMMGTAAEEILALYLLTGTRVVVLGSHPGEPVEGQLVRLHRHPDRTGLVEAVVTLADPSGP